MYYWLQHLRISYGTATLACSEINPKTGDVPSWTSLILSEEFESWNVELHKQMRAVYRWIYWLLFIDARLLECRFTPSFVIDLWLLGGEWWSHSKCMRPIFIVSFGRTTWQLQSGRHYLVKSSVARKICFFMANGQLGCKDKNSLFDVWDCKVKRKFSEKY